MTLKIIIIGSGLGGCTVASKLCEWADVTFIQERANKPINAIPKGIIDENGEEKPHEFAGAGLGGSSRYWHNGLIEIRDDTLETWPIKKEDLSPYIKKAFKSYSGEEIDGLYKTGKELRKKYLDLGVADNITCQNPIYYPQNRINAWKHYNLEKKVTVCDGYANKFDYVDGKIKAVYLETGEKIEGDLFIISAGGLQTPALLQTLQKHNLCKNAGHFYEDHPWCFAGDIKLKKDFYKLWNYHTKFGGTMRQPLVIKQDGQLISFFLRPSFHLVAAAKSAPIKSVMSDLRNKPLQIKNYFKLLTQLDDIFDIISFKLGINLKTDTFSLHLVGTQPHENKLSVSKDDVSGKIQRKWNLNKLHSTYEKALQKLLKDLGNNLVSSQLFDNRWNNLESSAHHSGTARMAKNETEGVCDKDCKIFNISNAYVCDGSVIPNSGTANTGLTIGALSYRLADHLKSTYSDLN